MFNQIFNKKVVLPFFQILGVISIFQWIVFPGLTAADTIVNILSIMIGFFTLLGLYYIVNSWFVKESDEEKQMEAEWKEHIQKQMKAMDEMHKQNESLKKKSNPKQMDGVESDKPFVKTRKKATTKKTK